MTCYHGEMKDEGERQGSGTLRHFHWSTRINHNTTVYIVSHCPSAGHVHNTIVDCIIRLYQDDIHIQLYSVDQSQEPVAEPCRLRNDAGEERRGEVKRGTVGVEPRCRGAQVAI